MEPTLDQSYCRLLVLGRKALRLFVPALLVVTVLTVVGGVPAGAQASATANSGSTWTTQTVPSGTSYLNAIACPSTTTCYAVGQNNSNAVGVILATTNSGSTWTTQTLPSGTALLYGIACTSTTTCYAVGAIVINIGSSGFDYGYILATTNSGSTWSAQTGFGPTGISYLSGIVTPWAKTARMTGASFSPLPTREASGAPRRCPRGPDI